MINPIKFDNQVKPNEQSTSSLINMDFFTKSTTEVLTVPYTDVMEEPSKPKRGRPPKKKIVDGQEIITPDDGNQSSGQLAMYQSNEPYIESYNETNNMLKTSIMQIDLMQGEIRGDLDSIRASKTLKKKYDYIAMLSSTVSSLVSSKLTAVREINKVITDCHNLEIKRVKDLKMDAAEVDDDKRIMDMYNAFISTPMGSYNTPAMSAMPNMAELTLMSPNDGIMRQDMINPAPYNINPMVQRMVTMENPNIKTVVVYDPGSGRRWFDVINTQTGESVPSVDKPDPMFLEDTTIDVRNGIARNVNLDTTYPLITINNPSLDQY